MMPGMDGVELCNHTVRPEDLPDSIRNYRLDSETKVDSDATESIQLPKDWPTLSALEGQYVTRVLVHTRGNKQAAARLLDVDPKTLVRMIKRHKIELKSLAMATRHG